MANYTIGKRMTAFPPHAMIEQNAGPFLTGGIPKVASVLTVATGPWRGLGSLNPKFQWYSGASSIVNATNASFSVQSAGNYFLTARLSMGNAVWGTWYKDVSTGTVAA